jgi:hypothetical protein
MTAVERVRIQIAEKIRVFIMMNRRRFGIGPNTALSIDRDFDPLENVKDLVSTFVMLYLARQPLLRTVLWAKTIAGFGLTRLTNSSVSRNLNYVFESVYDFIRKTFCLDLVSLICSRTPGSRYCGTLQMSQCNRP